MIAACQKDLWSLRQSVVGYGRGSSVVPMFASSCHAPPMSKEVIAMPIREGSNG
jgi:hypothetical protein